MNAASYSDAEYVLAEIITEATGEPRVGRLERSLAKSALRRLRELGLTLPNPPADDVREALGEEDGCDPEKTCALCQREDVLEEGEPFDDNGVWRHLAGGAVVCDRCGMAAADAAKAAKGEVRPRGAFTDADRLEYTVAAESKIGAITQLAGYTTVVREHLEADLILFRQQETSWGGEPDRIFIAERPIQKWVRS